MFRRTNVRLKCEPSPFDPDDEVCDEFYGYQGQPLQVEMRSEIEGARSVFVEAAIAKLHNGVTETDFLPFERFPELSIAEVDPWFQSSGSTEWYAVIIRVTVTPMDPNVSPAITYKTFIPRNT